MKILRRTDDFEKLSKWLDFLRFCGEQNARGRRDPMLSILGAFTVAVAVLIALALLLVANDWSPGQQDAIARRYRAHQHEAALLAQDEPSVEIRP